MLQGQPESLKRMHKELDNNLNMLYKHTNTSDEITVSNTQIKEEILKSENKMVKKIRVIDELDETPDVQQTLMEIAKSIDWKLWELLQTMQRLEKKLSVINDVDDEE
jgi:multidrug efflux pump subunit AcrA (membrane-fusion protein)